MIKKIGFIGLGVMGISMARNLMNAGFELYVYTRTKAKAEGLIAEGANWCNSVDECSRGRDAIITIVGYPHELRKVYFGDESSKGILDNADKGTYLIDMTTSEPKLAEEIYKKALEKNLYALDAPVSGGDSGAKNASLSIMVGGDENIYNACIPIFEALGKTINYMGIAGSGQITKAANQLAIAGVISGVCEALSFAKASGLDPLMVHNCIKNGAAGSWQMSNNGLKILEENMAPGFYIKHYVKDLNIVLQKAQELNLSLPVFKQVIKMYEELEKEGFGDLGTQALIKYYNKEEQ